MVVCLCCRDWVGARPQGFFSRVASALAHGGGERGGVSHQKRAPFLGLFSSFLVQFFRIPGVPRVWDPWWYRRMPFVGEGEAPGVARAPVGLNICRTVYRHPKNKADCLLPKDRFGRTADQTATFAAKKASLGSCASILTERSTFAGTAPPWGPRFAPHGGESAPKNCSFSPYGAQNWSKPRFDHQNGIGGRVPHTPPSHKARLPP